MFQQVYPERHSSATVPSSSEALWGIPWGGVGGPHPISRCLKACRPDVSGAVGPNPTPYWIAMIEGVVRMLFPTAFARIEAGSGQNAGDIIAAAVVLALLGAMLIA